MKLSIPKEIRVIAEALNREGFVAYLVGGCVRDLLLRQAPKDWDIATPALPREIQKIFPDSVYENKFGTVAIKTRNSNESLKIVEITTFRTEGRYTDKRHPDEIKFAKTIEEDLSRRDFTINALALNISSPDDDNIVDPFGGREDLKKEVVRTVGEPDARFSEDALRLMRVARFATELGFDIEEKTKESVQKNSKSLINIASERIRDELEKIIMAKDAADGIRLLEELALLTHIIPELREGIGVSQNKHHIYTVWEHNVRALEYAAKQGYSLEIRLGALLHDVGKPRTKAGDGPDATFYNHEIVGGKMTAKIMERLRFAKEIAKKVTHLVRYHLFYYNVGEVSESGVRRFIRRVGIENIPDLIKIREADRIGSGVPKAVPYKLRHLLFMIEKVGRDPISHKNLKISGNDVIDILKIEPGPRVGQVLAVLLDDVIENPEKNKKTYLKKRAKELGSMSDAELNGLAQKANERKEEFEEGVEEKMKKKYYVK